MNHPRQLTGSSLLAIACIASGMGCHPNRADHGERHAIVWMIDPSRESESAAVRFRFPPPHDSYAGEVLRVQGMLHLDEEFKLARKGGWFRVEVMEVSLGEPDLDENVRNNAEFLSGRQFPNATFQLREIAADPDRLIRGRRAEVILHGDFSLKGVIIPLSVPATMEVVSRSDGRSVLLLCGSFVLEGLRQTFGIAGPGAEDDPAGNRLLFEFRFRLVPRSRSPQ